jgi:hypothetical protein
MALQGFCLFGAKVDECPTDGTPVAYCLGHQNVFVEGMVMTYDVIKVVYESAVNPDAASVARNIAVCGLDPVYDTDDNLMTATCSGSVTAKVDGELVEFNHLVCTFTSDGTRATYFIDATDDPQSPDAKSLNLSVFQDEMGVSLKTLLPTSPPVGYSEGGAVAGVYATPEDPMAITYTSDTFDATGEGLTGSFEIGGIKNGGGTVREITEGTIDVTFAVE